MHAYVHRETCIQCGLCPGVCPEVFSILPGEFRTSPAGGATTRLSAPRGKQGSTIRLFAGTDNPLVVASTLDNALRN